MRVAGNIRMVSFHGGETGRDAADFDPESIRQTIDSAPPYEPPAAPVPGTPRNGERPDWVVIGRWIGSLETMKRGFRYDGGDWWNWERNRWQILAGADSPIALLDHLADRRFELAHLAAEESHRDYSERLAREGDFKTNKRDGMLAGLRLELRRSWPDVHNDAGARAFRQSHLAVPSGVVDLRTGNIVKHDPLIHDTRAITAGDYRPTDLDYLLNVLRLRLDPVFDDSTFTLFCRVLGLTLSGRAQSYRPMVLCIGRSGNGKSGTVKLVKASLGDRGKVLGNHFLARSGGEMDVDRYNLMLHQPLLVAFEEVAEADRLVLDKLLSLTGDAPLPSARLPHSHVSLSDTIPSAFWMTCVNVPKLSRGSGIQRRLIALPFSKHIEEVEKDADAAFSQELLDAVVTVGIAEARAVYQEGYRPLEGPAEFQAKVLDDMDPLAAWLEDLPDEFAGKPVLELVEIARESVGDKRITSSALGKRINTSSKWHSIKETKGENRLKRVLKPRPPGLDL